MAARLQALTDELQRRGREIDRLRLAVTLREDRLLELERALRCQRERADAAEQALCDAQERARATDSARGPDDFRRIAGIGPVFARGIVAHGIERFEQLAALSPEGVAALAAALRVPVARIARAQWQSRAAALAAHDHPGAG